MKTYRPAWAAWACFHVSVTFWTTALAALAFSAFEICLVWPRPAHCALEAEVLQILCVAVVIALGLLVSLSGMLRYPRARYEIGATEITIHEAGIMHSTRAFPLLSFTGVEVYCGPLQRAFGVAHVILHRKEALNVRMLGLADAEEARRFIEERRARLRESEDYLRT